MRNLRRDRSITGALLASVLVAVAVAGPPIVGKGVRPIVEIRHSVLMIDREFERIAIQTSGASRPDFTIADDRAPASRFKLPPPGDRAWEA